MKSSTKVVIAVGSAALVVGGGIALALYLKHKQEIENLKQISPDVIVVPEDENTLSPDCACQTCPPGSGSRPAPNIDQQTFQVMTTAICQWPDAGEFVYTIDTNCGLVPLVVAPQRFAMFSHPYKGVYACNGGTSEIDEDLVEGDVGGGFALMKCETCPKPMSYIYVTDPNTADQTLWMKDTNDSSDGLWNTFDGINWNPSMSYPIAPFVVYVDPNDPSTLYYYAPVTEPTVRTVINSGRVCQPPPEPPVEPDLIWASQYAAGA